MDKNTRKQFEQLSEEALGHKSLYKKILKHGYKYMRPESKILYVRHYTEDQLYATLVGIIKQRQELAAKEQEKLEILNERKNKETKSLPGDGSKSSD